MALIKFERVWNANSSSETTPVDCFIENTKVRSVTAWGEEYTAIDVGSHEAIFVCEPIQAVLSRLRNHG